MCIRDSNKAAVWIGNALQRIIDIDDVPQRDIRGGRRNTSGSNRVLVGIFGRIVVADDPDLRSSGSTVFARNDGRHRTVIGRVETTHIGGVVHQESVQSHVAAVAVDRQVADVHRRRRVDVYKRQR